MSFNSYRKREMEFGGFTPVWLEVNGVKQGGGTIKGDSGVFATDFPVGTVIPAGTPCRLSKAGGDITILRTFELVHDVSTSETIVVVKPCSCIDSVHTLKKGLNLRIDNSNVPSPATGVAVGDVTVDPNGNLSFSITANAFGVALKAGEVLVEASKAGASADFKVIPNGLIWHDIVIESGDYAATGAVVDNGRIFGSRIAPVSNVVRNAVPTIIYEMED